VAIDPGLLNGKLVIDAMNYWPASDGVLEAFEDEGSSEVVARRLAGSTVVKALNHIGYHELEDRARPAGAPDRQAAGVAGDDPAALLDLSKVIEKTGVPQQTLDLVHLRVSQINGCAACVYLHSRDLGKAEKTDERLLMVAAWREAPHFNDAERAALALAEAVTRLSDREDPVPEEVWGEAARIYNEQELGALVMAIGLVNLWIRVNVSTKQVPGAGWN
jgi:AhpD family alkylhydroperoxidase